MAYLTEFHEEDFTAVAIYTGENRLVRVTGFGTSPTPGFTLTLEGANPGINPNPTELVLQIVEVAPTDIQPQVITKTFLTGDTTFDVSQQVATVVLRGLFSLTVTEPA